MESWAEVFRQSVAKVAQRLIEYLPNILGFLALLVTGLFLAWLLSSLSLRLASKAFDRLSRTKHLETPLRESTFYRSMPVFVSRFICWSVFLVFLAASIEALGIPAVSNVLGWITAYLPRILASVLIVIGGLWGGHFIRALLAKAGEKTGIEGSDLLGRGAQILLVLLTVTIAIEQLGIDNTVLLTAIAIGLGVSFAAVGLAFGLGARATVGNIVAAHYVRKTFRPGDHVRVENTEGTVLEITLTSVIIETAEGRMNIPADRFNREPSLFLRERA